MPRARRRRRYRSTESASSPAGTTSPTPRGSNANVKTSPPDSPPKHKLLDWRRDDWRMFVLAGPRRSCAKHRQNHGDKRNIEVAVIHASSHSKPELLRCEYQLRHPAYRAIQPRQSYPYGQRTSRTSCARDRADAIDECALSVCCACVCTRLSNRARRRTAEYLVDSGRRRRSRGARLLRRHFIPNSKHRSARGRRVSLSSTPTSWPFVIRRGPRCSPASIRFGSGTPHGAAFRARRKSERCPQCLKQAGYATAVAGKWQLTLLKDDLQQPHRMGFDEYCLYGWHEGPWYYQPHIWQNGKLRDDVRDRYGPDVICDYLIDFIERKRTGRSSRSTRWRCATPRQTISTKPAPVGPNGRYDSYAEMVVKMDERVGRVVAALDRLGMRENTLIIYLTDNGTAARTICRRQGR